ncbi:tropomyosin-like [Drosophila serrata]|uniref:tropomyosin-like n=1 Tax=Drosophila serrata TaxID=7274 RepID=UPI000A1D2B2B|nr:tropomyosin-like [Drosophila serrata]
MTNAKNIKVGAELQEQLESEQQWRTELEERIQKLEKDLELAEETLVTLQEQLEETTVHAEVRISEEENDFEQSQNTIDILQNQHEAALVKIKELQQSAEAAAQLRQDVSNLKGQLQSSQDLLKNLQDIEQKEQDLREELAKKDMLFIQVTQELAARDEQLKYFAETLKEEQKKWLSQEHTIKLLQERVERFSCLRSELELRNSALETEIVRLKHEVRNYAEIIVGNEGEPFYEVRQSKSA